MAHLARISPIETAGAAHPWFAESARLLVRAGRRAEPVAGRDLQWDRAGELRFFWRWVWSLLTSPSLAEVSVWVGRRRDVDGNPIFLDEHDAPFVLIPDLGQIYVRVFRERVGRATVLLTEPDPDPPLRYLAPRERAVRALRGAVAEAMPGLTLTSGSERGTTGADFNRILATDP